MYGTLKPVSNYSNHTAKTVKLS